MRMRFLFFVPALILSFSGTASWAQVDRTSCVLCHANPDLFEDDLLSISEAFRDDIHAGVGLSCHDCHGGNPDAALADDMDAAMDSGFGPNPYRGVPGRQEIPGFCGKCHSDPKFMRQFKPDPRVDQEQEYWTSHHGVALASGDERVATCVDCHHTHGIRSVADAQAPVYATNVAQTCSACHSDPEWMSGYTLPNGRPLPVDQHARWSLSVHAQAMLEKGDLSAPTCNDCHGNHGASPPGMESVAFVCGQCHGRETELFRSSPKRRGFHEHNEYMADVGPEGCAGCHEDPEPQAKVDNVLSFTECTTCHRNHAVIRPTVVMLGNLPDTPCAFCHEEPNASAEASLDLEQAQKHYAEVRASLMREAEEKGLDGNDRFDWLVDEALQLSTHTVIGTGEGDEVVQLRPEFDRLFQKFRIGKTQFSYVDPVTGSEQKEAVVTCNRCHAGDGVGSQTGKSYLEQMRVLTARTAAAERLSLAAQRGGVEVREGLSALDGAVSSQIELEVLVHTFSASPDEAFAQKAREGLAHADEALELAEAGLDELSSRRRGLFLALIFIALTAAGLYMWIRR